MRLLLESLPLFANLRFDFGYPWWLSYGHAALFVPALFLLLASYKFKWSKWLRLGLSALTLWSGCALLVARFAFDANGLASLPTQNFLRGGTGVVLDLGAGTGRSSIMVLKARPQVNLVALDLFADSYERHFGHIESPERKLLTNLQAAGVDGRAKIQRGDMRKLPFDAGAFDGVVSAYAVDHLNSPGVGQTINEARRVLKPGGDFLLILVGKEPWGRFAFGPLLTHMGGRGADWWRARLQEANFQVLEEGTEPVTLYFLSRRH